MKKLILLALSALLLGPAYAASPTDIVPRASGLYDALAVLAQDHLLPPGSPDVQDLLNVQGRLYTRAELARAIRDVARRTSAPTPNNVTNHSSGYTVSAQIVQSPDYLLNNRDRAALAFARNILAPELGLNAGSGGKGTAFGASGVAEAATGSRSDQKLAYHSQGNLFARGRVFGTLGRDGAYTVSATNFYTQFRDHGSFTTRASGTAGGDNPGGLNGIDEAYATVFGNHGLRATAGLIRQRWSPSYRGALLVGDNGPAHPTLQAELPFSLGRTLGRYDFTQYESTFRNGGRTIYQGGRRLEHPLGDRTTISLEEAYQSNQFNKPLVLVVPFYTFQAHAYPGNTEPRFFNYLADANLTVRPNGPNGNSRVYGEFLLDDIKAPKGLGLGNNTPRKLAYLVGYAQVFPRSGTDAVLEYNRTDRATFTDAESELAWFDNDLPQGSPVGPNGREVFGRIGQKLGPKLDIAVEARDRRRVANDFPAPNQRAIDVLVGYRLAPSRSLGLRLSDYREEPFVGQTSSVPGQFGGAAYGQRLRRRLFAVSFLQSF